MKMVDREKGLNNKKGMNNKKKIEAIETNALKLK